MYLLRLPRFVAVIAVLVVVGCGYVKGPLDSKEAARRTSLVNLRPWNIVILSREKDAGDDTGNVAKEICERISRIGKRYYTEFPACFQSGDTYLAVDYCSKMDGVSMRFSKDIREFSEKRPHVRCTPTRYEYTDLDPRQPDVKLGEIHGDNIRRKYGTPNGRGEGRYTYSFGVHERTHCVGERWYGADIIIRMEAGGIVEAIEYEIPGRGC